MRLPEDQPEYQNILSNMDVQFFRANFRDVVPDNTDEAKLISRIAQAMIVPDREIPHLSNYLKFTDLSHGIRFETPEEATLALDHIVTFTSEHTKICDKYEIYDQIYENQIFHWLLDGMPAEFLRSCINVFGIENLIKIDQSIKELGALDNNIPPLNGIL